jgi:hypothetical protein
MYFLSSSIFSSSVFSGSGANSTLGKFDFCSLNTLNPKPFNCSCSLSFSCAEPVEVLNKSGVASFFSLMIFSITRLFRSIVMSLIFL